jgi:hypothetical protein
LTVSGLDYLVENNIKLLIGLLRRLRSPGLDWLNLFGKGFGGKKLAGWAGQANLSKEP